MRNIQKEKKPEGILQNIVTYFCFKANPLNTTKLVKLVYIADVYHYQTYGKRLSKVPFKHYHYGPWAPDVGRVSEELYAKGVLYEKTVQTKKRAIAIIPKPNVPQTIINLPKTAIEILEIVIEDWGKASSDEVAKFTKETLPFLNTAFDEKINFSRTDAIAEYAKRKGISKEKAATLDIISDKTLKERVIRGLEDAEKGKFLKYEEVFND